MHFFLVLLLALHCQALTYWLDPRCGELVQKGIEEAVRGASLAKQKLEARDPIMLYSYDIIFKAFPAEAYGSFADVKRRLGVLAQLDKAMTHTVSDIRFMCDDDKPGPGSRWRLIPDRQYVLEEGEVPNSERADWDKEYWDAMNWMTTRHPPNEPPYIGVTYDRTTQWAQPPPGTNPNRELIVLCPSSTDEPMLLNQTPFDRDLTALTMGQWSSLLSMTIAHEICHLTGTCDMPAVPDPVGWQKIMEGTTENNLKSPDAYAFLGVLAQMANDFDVRLSPDEAAAKRGELVFIPRTMGRRNLATDASISGPKLAIAHVPSAKFLVRV